MRLCLQNLTPCIGKLGGRYFQYQENNKKKYCSMNDIIKSSVEYLDQLKNSKSSKSSKIKELKEGKRIFSIDLINSMYIGNRTHIEKIKRLNKKAEELLAKKNCFIKFLTKIKSFVGAIFFKLKRKNYKKCFDRYDNGDEKRRFTVSELKEINEALKKRKKEGNLNREGLLSKGLLKSYINQRAQEVKNVNFKISSEMKKELLIKTYYKHDEKIVEGLKEKASIETKTGDNFAVSTCIGGRGENQDSFRIVINEKKYPGTQFYGVFDGHGGKGKKASLFTAQNAVESLFEEVEKNSNNEEKEKSVIVKSLTHIFENVDKKLFTEVRKKEHFGKYIGGSTACLAYVKNKEIYFSNVGDSRACIYNGGRIFQTTKDQKGTYSRDLEKNSWGEKKSTINCKRAIGIYGLRNDKEARTAKARVTSVDISSLGKGPTYLIMGSDGLFNFISTNQIGKVTKEMLDKNFSLEQITNNLVRYAVQATDATKPQYLTDNTTVIVAKL
jgi:serine/threonine protein phosphatase PrpC